MAREFMRRIGQLTYSSGRVERLDLPRNNVYKGLLLRLRADITIAGGAADATLHDEQPQSLLQAIRVIRNGSEVLQSLSGGTMYALSRINSDGDANRVPLAGAGVQANTIVTVDIPVDFASWRMANPGVTLLRAVGTSSLDLEIGWGSEASIFTGGDRTETINSATVTVYGLELLDITGDYGDKILTPVTKQVTVASDQFEVDLPTGPLYRRLIFKCTDSAGFNLSNAIIESIKIESDGVFAHVDRFDYDVLQSHNRRLYSLGANLDGYVVVDFAQDGNPGGLIDTRGASSFKAILEVATGSGTTQVETVLEQVIPARVAQAA